MTEQLVEVGEIEMNYATLGDPSLPAWLSAYAKPGRSVAGRGGSLVA